MNWMQIQTCTRQIQDLELDTDLYKTDTRSGTRYRLVQDRYKIWNSIQTCTRQIQDMELDTDLYKTDTRSGTRYRLVPDRYKIWIILKKLLFIFIPRYINSPEI